MHVARRDDKTGQRGEHDERHDPRLQQLQEIGYPRALAGGGECAAASGRKFAVAYGRKI
jgi:hypothetical protein